MDTIEITDIRDPRVAVYSMLTDGQLRSRQDTSRATIIVESPKVIRVALRSGYEPLSMLCERRHIEGDAADILRDCEQKGMDFPVYTGTRETLAGLTGYELTRGVICAMRRPVSPVLEDICRNASRLAVIDGVVDTTNIGAIFRSAAALGIDAVLLSANSCDPFNRRSIRVSMGSVFLVPWTWLPANEEDSSLTDYSLLRSMGFKTVAMALTDRSVSIEDPALKEEPKLAIILGTEGEGLPEETINGSDYVVRIPMYHEVDSLNVASASAVAFWELRARSTKSIV